MSPKFVMFGCRELYLVVVRTCKAYSLLVYGWRFDTCCPSMFWGWQSWQTWRRPSGPRPHKGRVSSLSGVSEMQLLILTMKWWIIEIVKFPKSPSTSLNLLRSVWQWCIGERKLTKRHSRGHLENHQEHNGLARAEVCAWRIKYLHTELIQE